MSAVEHIFRWFRRRAVASNQAALLHAGSAVTYRELDRDVQQLSGALCRLQQGTVVGVYIQDPIAMIQAAMACLCSGVVFLPLDPAFPQKRLRLMVEVAEPEVLLLSQQTLESARELFSDLSIAFWDVRQPEPGGGPTERYAAPDDPAYITFTSGSSGTPKGILGRTKSIAQFIRWEIDTLRPTPDMRCSMFTTPSFDAWLRDLFVPLCSGGTVCIPERETLLDAHALTQWLHRYQVNVIHCVPSLFRRLLTVGDGWAEHIEHILLAGEPLLPADIHAWTQRHGTRAQLYNLYGPSETTMVRVCHPVRERDITAERVPVGRPIHDTRILLLDGDGNPVNQGEVGTIHLCTAYATLGYLDPAQTQAAFRIDPQTGETVYNTGDLGLVNAEGLLEILGRADRQVKIRGVRVEPGEIEKKLSEHAAVTQCAVTSRSTDTGLTLVAHVVLSTVQTPGDLRQFLAGSLPAAMVPNHYGRLDQMPLLPNGKIDYHALAAMEPTWPLDAIQGPRNETESMVLSVWHEMLKRTDLGVHTHFFEAGGHSLLAASVVYALNQQFGPVLRLRHLFDHPTPSGLAALLEHTELSETQHHAPSPPIGPAELTKGQEAMWLLNQMEPDSAYLMPLIMEVTGPLHIDALRRALQTMAQRHRTLGQRFVTVAGRPHVTHDHPIPVTVLPLTPDVDQETLTETAWAPIDLDIDAPIRVVVYHAPDRAWLIVTQHHIISDAASIDIFLKEWSQAYAAEIKGGIPDWSPLPADYAGFMAQQHADFARDGQQHLAWWRNYLQGAPTRVRLPTDRAENTGMGGCYAFTIPDSIADPFRACLETHRVTPFMGLLTALAALLVRHNPGREIVLGMPVSMRHTGPYEGLLGMFLTTMPLRFSFHQGDTATLLQRARRDFLDGIDRLVPIETLIQALNPPRQSGVNPLYQVSLVYQARPDAPFELEGVECIRHRFDKQDAKLDLQLFVIQTSHGFDCTFKYKADLFSTQAMTQLARHFQDVLTDLAAGRPVVASQTAMPIVPDHVMPTRPTFEAPLGPIEKQLAVIFEQVLDLEEVGRHQDFFASGGHSLLAMQVIGRIRATLCSELPMRALFDHPTPAGLAGVLAKMQPKELRHIPLAPQGTTHPVTEAQRRLWVLDRLGAGGAYVVRINLRLQGPLQEPALRQSFADLQKRHPILCAFFQLQDMDVIQDTDPRREAKLRHFDLRGMTSQERDSEIQRRLKLAKDEPFNLAEGPMIRATLITQAEEVHLLLVTIHHIVADDRARTILAQDLAARYAEHCRGDAPPIEPLRPDFRDYAVWQRQHLASDLHHSQLSFWKTRLADLPTLLMLPWDKPRPAVPTWHGGRVDRPLSGKAMHRWRTLCQEQEATPFMGFLTVFAVLLSRYSASEDIPIGIPFTERVRPELNQLVGSLVNTLVMRIGLQDNPSFSQLLARARDFALAAYTQADIPFEVLVNELQPERSPGHNPLFQVMLVYRNATEAPAQWHELSAEPIEAPLQRAKFDLTLVVEEYEERFDTRLIYSSDLFNGDTASRLLQHLHNLVTVFSKDTATPVQSVDLMDEVERRRVLVDWNAGRDHILPVPALHQYVAEQARNTPDRIALITETTQITYAYLNQQANQLAHCLRRHGAGPETKVGVCLPREAELIIALLAVLKSGAGYVSLDPAYPAERIAFMAADADLDLFVAHKQITRKGTLVHPADVGAEPTSNPICRTRPEHLAYVLYTSGSTGRPKGVLIPHRGALALIDWAQHRFSAASLRGVLAGTSTCFDLSVFEIFVPLSMGGAVILADNAPSLIDHPHAQRVTLINTVPSAITQLDKEGGIPPSVRTINLAGEPLRGDLVRRLFGHKHIAHIYNLYGPSEDTTYTTWFAADANDPREPGIGRPLDHTQTYVLTESLRPVPPGVIGTLYTSGKGLARGYHRRPALTAERFVPHPFSTQAGARLYNTGDLARYRMDGCLVFLGRRDHQVKLHGFRIELGEIETVLQNHPNVEHAAVLVHDGDRLIAWLTLRQTQLTLPCRLNPHNAADLLEHLDARLPEYMVPRTVVALDGLPLNPNGKIDRGKLRTFQPPAVDSHTGTEAPRTETESMLAAIWQRVLGQERVGLKDNFFELGGDSILAIQVAARAAQQGLTVHSGDLFRYQTVLELAAVVHQQEIIPAQQGRITGVVPPGPIQRWLMELADGVPHHFNQARLFRVNKNLDAGRLQQALDALPEHHDMLRLCTEDRDGIPTLILPDAIMAVPFQVHDFRESLDWVEALIAVSNQCHRAMDLTQGPALRAALIRTPLADDRLLLVGHHLAVDGVTWQTLIQDLSSLYNGQVLPPKTTAFPTWSGALPMLAASPELQKELAYWTSPARQLVRPLPVDFHADPARNTQGTLKSVKITLDAATTNDLLHRALKAWKTRVDDLLQAALAMALHHFTGYRTNLVDVERHGRDLFGNMNLSRTAGWFTTQFPLLLQVPEGSMDEVIKAVKEQMRRVPRNGAGYGILRCLDPARADQLAAMPQAQVLFNYLGRYDRLPAMPPILGAAHESTGINRDPKVPRAHLISINGYAAEDGLHFAFGYSTAFHKEATVAQLATAFKSALEELVRHCLRPGIGGLTPSDCRELDLDQADLDQLTARLRGMEALYPLSPMQGGMLFHHLLHPDAGFYCQQWRFRLPEDTDLSLLRQAWEQVVQRNEILRTHFVTQGMAQPAQVVCTHAPLDWALIETQDTAAFLDEDRRHGFSLQVKPPTRVRILKDGDIATMIWTHHHVLLDGWSVPQIMDELCRIYNALKVGEQPEPSRRRPYGAYITWLFARDHQQDEAFWKRRLAGFSEPTPPPGGRATDKPLRAENAVEIRHYLTTETTEALRDLARRNRLTLNTLVQGAWSLLLARYSGKRDVLFGITVSGRPASLPGAETMVGLFIQTIPMRVLLPGEVSLMPWLRTLQETRADMEMHGHAGLAQIQGWSELGPGHALFDTLFLFENYPRPAGVSNSWRLSIEGVTERTNYPLALFVGDKQRVSLKLVIQPDRVAQATAQELPHQLEALLNHMIRRPDAPLHSFSLLDESQRFRILQGFNETSAAYPADQPLHRLIEAQSAQTPNATALIWGNNQLTYGRLDAMANRLARLLLQRGVKPGAPVGICLERGGGMVISLLAVMKTGAYYVPLDPAFPRQRLVYMLAAAGSSHVITTQDTASLLPSVRQPILLDHVSLIHGDDRPLPNSVHPLNLAYTIFTSGSTGKPKGVQVPHRALVNFLTSMRRQPGITKDDTLLAVTTLSFDIAGLELFLPLLVGGKLIIAGRIDVIDGSRLLDIIQRHRVSIMQATPSTWRFVSAAASGKMPRLTMLCGGEALPTELAKQLTGHTLFNMYGPTETTIWSTLFPVIGPQEGAVVGIGKPIANTRIAILDEDMEPVPVGVTGHLFIGGDGLAQGYLDRPALTARVFLPDPHGARSGARLYRTGDLATWLPDGNIQFLGRADHQLKIRGYRVEPGEIEGLLAEQDGVHQAVVIPRELDGEIRLVAYLVGVTSIDTGALRRQLAAQLPHYMIPAAMLCLEALPMTPNGKLDRKALPDPTPVAIDTNAAPVEPLSETEEGVAAIWSQILPKVRIGKQDGFFELGGHSLHLVRLHGNLQDTFGIVFPLVELYRHPSLHDLAQYLDSLREGDGPQTTVTHRAEQRMSRRNDVRKRRNLRRKPK